MKHHFAYAARLNSFRARPELYTWKFGTYDVRDLLLRANTVPGLKDLYLNFPEHIDLSNDVEIRRVVSDLDVSVRGLNLRFPNDKFFNGAFTNPDARIRTEAIELCKRAVDMARKLAADHVILWLGLDGFDYPFQVDYSEIWDREIEGITEVARYAEDTRVSIEYKPSDPRRYSLIGDIGTTLHAIAQCNARNLGVTLDYSHMLMARENPALSATLAARTGKLFGIHLNDGYGYLDDGLMVGATTPLMTIDLILSLLQFKYSDVVYFDTFPVREDPVQECTMNIERVEQLCLIVEHLDAAALAKAHHDQDFIASYRMIRGTLV